MKIKKLLLGKIFRKSLEIFLGTLTGTMVLTGSMGLFLAYINPIPWIAHYFPIQLNNILWSGIWVNITGEQAFQQIKAWQAAPILAAAVSATVIILGLMIHVQNFKTWWKI